MNRGKDWKLAVGTLAVGLWMASTATSVAEAQFNPRARPRFGFTNLQRGFMPDPQIVRGTMGGPVSASQIDASCRGTISPRPNHVVRSRTGFGQIRFVVNGQQDATLMVMLPNGQILCDDDSGEGTHPLIATSSPPGPIRVWVGSYSSGTVGSPYVMGITELSHISASDLHAPQMPYQPPQVQYQPTTMVAGVNPQMPPAFGQLNLRRGFMPDPQIVSGTAGGPVSASQVNSACRGYITARPTHVIHSPTGFQNLLRLIVNSRIDTTLVVMLPNGQIVCDDDGGDGLNPLVSFSTPPGPIRVWVGSYSGQTGTYSLGVSELTSVSTSSVPLPGVVVTPPPPTPPPPQPAEFVQMNVNIPVTLMGPGLAGNTVALWNPRGGPATQIRLNGRSLQAGNVTLGAVPPSMSDPVITVTQRRNGMLLIRAEQPGSGRRDPGQTMLLLVRWAGRPTVVERWSGTSLQRGPGWSR